MPLHNKNFSQHISQERIWDKYSPTKKTIKKVIGALQTVIVGGAIVYWAEELYASHTGKDHLSQRITKSLLTPEEIIYSNNSKKEKINHTWYTHIDIDSRIQEISEKHTKTEDDIKHLYMYEKFRNLPFYHTDQKGPMNIYTDNLEYYLWYGFWMFPTELIEDKVSVVLIGDIDQNTKEKYVLAYAVSNTDVMKINHEEVISDTTIKHELIYLIFEHSSNTFWTEKWEEEFAQYTDMNSFEREYWQTGDTREDMATMAESIFDVAFIKSLQNDADASAFKRDAVFFRKAQRLREYLSEITHGAMGEVYWELVDRKIIKDGYDAQRYFEARKNGSITTLQAGIWYFSQIQKPLKKSQ